MILWRISNHADLNGIGGLHASARWHTKGHPVIYLAETPSGALLESLVHLEIDKEDVPLRFQLIKVNAEDGIPFETVMPESLPDGWKASEDTTRHIGDEWLKAGKTALLRVPSAITPETWNWLLNPRHEEARRLQIVSAGKYFHDTRLIGK
jgi:RES domain-containing protein